MIPHLPIVTPLVLPQSIALASNLVPGATSAAPSLPLDNITSAVLAFSVARKLRTAYSGSAIRVRRSSDDTEQDIGFTGNELDTASLLTFCGAGDGFVVTWYEQSGHVDAVNMVQDVAARQPRIVSSGVIEASDSIPSANNNATSGWLQTATWATRPSSDAIIVMAASRVARTTTGFGTSVFNRYIGYGANGQPTTTVSDGQGNDDIYINGAFAVTNGVTANARDVLYDAHVAGQNVARFEGCDLSDAAYADLRNTTSATLITLGYSSTSEQIIITDTDEVASLESNMASFYGITLA